MVCVRLIPYGSGLFDSELHTRIGGIGCQCALKLIRRPPGLTVRPNAIIVIMISSGARIVLGRSFKLRLQRS